MENFENKLIAPKSEQKKHKFEYSPENPPPLEVLESKIFAVHSTPTLPENGIMKAGARDASIDKRWGDDEPPTFRPTFHFSLGELVREHGDYSWDDNSYAVVSPLKNLENQLINIFPHDTFILGDLHLQNGMILLVPKGTDISKLPNNIEIIEYDQKAGLRVAVDSVISKKQGWHIKMKPEGGNIGSIARIDDVDINDPIFFNSLFEKLPHVSFGSHVYSERGEAFRFGKIEEAVENGIKNYFGRMPSYETEKIIFFKSLIIHHLQKLDRAIKDSAIDQQALKTFEEKKIKLLGWVNIINCDLDARQKMKKTFSGAPALILNKIYKNRYDPIELKKIIDENYSGLSDISADIEYLQPLEVVNELSCLPAPELKEFISNNETLFDTNDLPEFYSYYAVQRWLIIKNKQAYSEGLDQMLNDSLKRLSVKPEETDQIFYDLKRFLNNDETNRLEVVLTILKNPAVKKYLREKIGMTFKKTGPTSLREVIAAHPKTKILFEPYDLSLPDEQKEAYQLLEALGKIIRPRIKSKILNNFNDSRLLALNIEHAKNKLQKNINEITKPLNTARNLSAIPAGEAMSLYEILRRDEKPVELWQRLGLAEEYQNKFETDESFWNSSQSLLEIYRMLKKLIKKAKNNKF